MGENIDFKDWYEKIDIPSELDLTIEKAIKRGKREKRARFIRPTAAAAVLIAVFVFTVNISPAFANFMESVPGLSYLVNLVKFDKGLTMAVENGCVQNINKYAEDKGIKFTVDNIVLDRKRLIIAYTIESKDGYKGLAPWSISVTGQNGEKIDAFLARVTPDNNPLILGQDGSIMDNLNLGQEDKMGGIIDVRYPGDGNETFPEDMVLNIKRFFKRSAAGSYNESPFSEEHYVEGNWNVEFKLDKVLTSVEPKIIDVQKEFTAGQMKFYIEYFKVYPTVINVKIRLDKDNPYRFTDFRDLYIEDEKGNRYTYQKITRPEEEMELNFESNYYIDAKELYLCGGGVFLMPREDQYLVVDLDSKKVIEDSGYSIEYLNDMTGVVENGKTYDFTMVFRINDEEILNNRDSFGYGGCGVWLDHKAYDENNNEYKFGRYTENIYTNERHSQFEISIEKMDKNIHTLKIKISGVAKGIMEPFRIKLNQ